MFDVATDLELTVLEGLDFDVECDAGSHDPAALAVCYVSVSCGCPWVPTCATCKATVERWIADRARIQCVRCDAAPISFHIHPIPKAVRT